MATNNMKKGALVYDENTGRIDIRFGLNSYYGGLHCGNTMEVQIGSKWIPTRIEMADDWYLVGVKSKELPGLIVRI